MKKKEKKKQRVTQNGQMEHEYNDERVEKCEKMALEKSLWTLLLRTRRTHVNSSRLRALAAISIDIENGSPTKN